MFFLLLSVGAALGPFFWGLYSWLVDCSVSSQGCLQYVCVLVSSLNGYQSCWTNVPSYNNRHLNLITSLKTLLQHMNTHPKASGARTSTCASAWNGLLEFLMGCEHFTHHQTYGGHTAANQAKGAQPCLSPRSSCPWPGSLESRNWDTHGGKERSLGCYLFNPSVSSTHHEIIQTACQVKRFQTQSVC